MEACLPPLLQPQERQGRRGPLWVEVSSQWLDKPRPTLPKNPLPSIALQGNGPLCYLYSPQGSENPSEDELSFWKGHAPLDRVRRPSRAYLQHPSTECLFALSLCP